MAAGLGFKTFTTGEVLTAADTNGYLMQGVLVFATAAARDAAITSPQEGQFAYLKDTNVTTYYTGSTWANLDTTGMTNPMTTTGDMIYSSSGSTPARLGIGSAGQVLTVAGGIPSWAAATSSAPSFSLLNGPSGTALTAASEITVSGISGMTDIAVIITGASSASASSVLTLRINGADPTTTAGGLFKAETSYAANNQSFQSTARFAEMSASATSTVRGFAMINGCNSTGIKMFSIFGGSAAGGSSGNEGAYGGGQYTTASLVTSVGVRSSAGNFDAGTIFVYGSAV